jgi:hypothetical protein
MLLKIFSFLNIQMLHAANTIISMLNGKFRLVLMFDYRVFSLAMGDLSPWFVVAVACTDLGWESPTL